jgi:DNA helicase II / ATP-dependent DNA helicase PcrA
VVLDELNAEQRAAAEAVRGRICILAGAGTGKTTTVTHRIAHQVSVGAFSASQVLAVTFTEKAAGELQSRLASLGVPGVRASTFHSAALAQLRFFVPESPLQILPAKVPLLRQIANRLPGAYRYRPAGDLATEIEWAKNRRIPPARYLDETRDRTPPIPSDLMFGVYREYERRKAEAGLVDFEDLLARTVALYEQDERAARVFRERYRAFTVDEYQDVNGLQQRLLELWLGDRDDLCAVGDDYQSIYGFTGAGPDHLLAFARTATVFRLELNYRSTSEVLALANRLVPRLGGAEKVLRPASPSGPQPELAGFGSWADEGHALVERISALHAAGIAYEQQAVLVRTNARSADLEELLHAAGVPFQGASLLDREGARSLLRRLRGARGPAADSVREVALSLGWQPDPVDDLGEREQTRQSDLSRIVAIAAGLEDVTKLAPELERRFGASVATGVHLLTLHRSKGLEWDAVFLPRLEDGELPIRRGDVDEERRLLYVGITRARRHLYVTWSGKPSRFLSELGVQKRLQPRRPQPTDLTPVGSALRVWRLERARADGVPAYVVFHDRTLVEIELARPATLGELAAIAGVGPVKIDRYGEDVLAVLDPSAQGSEIRGSGFPNRGNP